MEYEQNVNDNQIVTSAIDPRIRKCLNELNKKMRPEKQKERVSRVLDPNLRRCNKCGKYYPVGMTVSRKYYPHSTRKYRLCKVCSKGYKEVKSEL